MLNIETHLNENDILDIIRLQEIDEIIAASQHELVASSTKLEISEDLAWLEFFKDRQHW